MTLMQKKKYSEGVHALRPKTPANNVLHLENREEINKLKKTPASKLYKDTKKFLTPPRIYMPSMFSKESYTEIMNEE